MRLVSVLVFTLAGLGAGGCMTLHVRSIDAGFEGLRATMDRSHVVCMLLVHGMGGYSVGDPDIMIDALQKDLHLRPAGQPVTTSIPDGTQGIPGKLIRQDYVGEKGNMLRIYTLYWEPLTAGLKKKYLAFDDSPAVTKNRLPIENEIKQSIMNDTVPDVALYGGNFRRTVQRTVRVALKQMRTDLSGQKDYEYFFVSFSLGSKIIFDAVDGLEKDMEFQIGDDVVDRTASFFMLSNQYPLFALSAVSPMTRPADASDENGYETMLRFIQRKKERILARSSAQQAASALPMRLSIVSVNDPNDLLTYTIPASIREEFPDTLINVQMTVAKTAYLVPTYGYIVNPLTAHTGYGHDPDVIKLIIDGAKATPKK